ncbi:type II toxin-antitoxin system RnlB family antitoxin [Paenibacillus polysaccharolyticus]|uniref:type II toxin-antitoxin system RnlB family antitoxin n=1 Tax=Paenibacillus TaxID=44249 RepID=UPI0020A1F838|nr:type II toxin-antitoxin system RnlB family antitoxin [Paenibacillus polysaccharolyticus]MCP1136296.1 type II toxin-antitoxin system RnlB family antitoxin [Paenibacillus polysaccharolyticus]
MMFELQKINQPSVYSFLILSTSYFNPLDDLDQLEEELRVSLGENFLGKILFDLLLTNGNSSNRFIEATFEGNAFDQSSFKVPSNVDLKIKKLSSSYYSNNELFINSVVVSDSFKFLLKKGLV